MINNGRLKSRIVVYRKKTITTSIGSDKEIYAIYKTIYAEIRPLRGKEYLESVQLEHKITYKITIRFTDINETDYIGYQGKIFDIESVIDVENRHWDIELMCVEHKGKDIDIEEVNGTV